MSDLESGVLVAWGFESPWEHKGNNVIVCSCKGVTDTEIIALVDKGVSKYYDIQRETGAGKTCGSCAPIVIDVMAERMPGAERI